MEQVKAFLSRLNYPAIGKQIGIILLLLLFVVLFFNFVFDIFDPESKQLRNEVKQLEAEKKSAITRAEHAESVKSYFESKANSFENDYKQAQIQLAKEEQRNVEIKNNIELLEKSLEDIKRNGIRDVRPIEQRLADFKSKLDKFADE